MVSIDEAAKAIVAKANGVLFLDTCVLFDIVRAPMRAEIEIGTVERAIRLAEELERPESSFAVVLGSLVAGEWRDNASAVLSEVSAHIEKVDVSVARLDDSLTWLGTQADVSRFVPYGLVDRLADVSQRIMDRAIHLSDSEAMRLQAINRLYAGRPPARKNGQLKDCQIFEECRAVALSVRAAGFSGPVVFCTSNSKDYGEPKQLDSQLSLEMQLAGIEYATNLPWALSILKI